MKRKIFLTVAVTGILILFFSKAFALTKECGANAQWDYYYKNFRFYGSGDMYDYYSTPAPWYEKRDIIKTISIEDDITGIGAYSFKETTSLVSISIDSPLEKIGEGAFYSSSLESISFPSTVKYVGANAFYNCNSLGRFYVSDLTSHLKCVFENNYSNPATLTGGIYIGDEKVTSVTIPGEITSIPAYSFYNCRDISSLTLHEGITEIGDYAFYGCNSVSWVCIPSSVKKIGEKAFDGIKLYYNGSEQDWLDAGGAKSGASSVYFIYYVDIIDEHGSSFRYSTYAKDNIYLPDVEAELGCKIKLYTDAGFTNEFDADMVVLNNMTLYAKCIEKLDEYFNIANAELVNFYEVVNPTNDNKQNLLFLMLGNKQLLENEDYVVWYQSTDFPGTAKMLIVGIGDYYGYIEKSYTISGDYFTVDIGEDVVIRPEDAVLIDTSKATGDFEKLEYYLNGNYRFTNTTDNLTGKEWGYSDEGIHKINYITKEVTIGYQYVNGVVKLVKTTNHYDNVTNIKTMNNEVALVEIADILYWGRDKIFVKPKISPLYCADQTLTWTSSDESVASVDSFGVVTLHKAGYSKIRATSSNGKYLEVELDTSPLSIKNAELEIITENDGTYSFVLKDKYGILEENVHYTCKSLVDDEILSVEITGIGLYGEGFSKTYSTVELSAPVIKGLIVDEISGGTKARVALGNASTSNSIRIAAFDKNGALLRVKEVISDNGRAEADFHDEEIFSISTFIWTENLIPVSGMKKYTKE